MKIKFIETVLNQAFLLFFHDKLTKQFKKVLYKENYWNQKFNNVKFRLNNSIR